MAQEKPYSIETVSRPCLFCCRSIARKGYGALPKGLRHRFGGPFVFSEPKNLQQLIMRSKRINLVLHNGTPYGVRTAEMTNWNGKVTICPRPALKQLANLDIAENPAVYLLYNREENRLYVGETDCLRNRISNHALQKDFWEEFIACTSPEIMKTEVKYLEHALYNRLKEDGLVELENKTSMQIPTIRKEMQDAMDDFIDNTADILLSLGYTFMGASTDVQNIAHQGTSVICSGKGAEAHGIYSENGLMVKAGSTFAKALAPSTQEKYKALQNALREKQILVSEGESLLRLQENYLFSSPSAAASLVLGYSANGLMEWKVTDGKSIKEVLS